MTDHDPRLGARIRRARLAAGLTMAEVAHRANISQPYLSQIEHGARMNPSPDVLVRIAGALGVSVGSLFGDE